VLLADNADLTHAEVTLRRGTRFTVYPIGIPFWNRTSAIMRCETILSAIDGLSAIELQFFRDLFMHRRRYPLINAPVLDLALIAEFLARAGAPLYEVAAVPLIGLPRQIVLSFPDSLLYRKTRRALRSLDPPSLASRGRQQATVLHLNLIRNTDLVELDATLKQIKEIYSPSQTTLFDAGVFKIQYLKSKKGNLLAINHRESRDTHFFLFGDIDSIEYLLSVPKKKLSARTRLSLINNVNPEKLVLHYENRIYPAFERVYPHVLKIGDNQLRDRFMYLLQAVKRALEHKHRRDDFVLGRSDPYNREKVETGVKV
jgi:hypothetical protein